MGFAEEIAKLTGLATAPQRIAAAAAPKLAALVQGEFPAGVGPDGAPWRPLALSTLRKGRTPPPLTASGGTAGSVQATAEGANVRVTVDGYADFHQETRPMLPKDGALPASWDAAINAAAKEVL